MIGDVQFALRTLRRTSGLTLTAVATLALGIGLTTAICSVFESVLLRQLPFRDPQRVVSATLESSDPRGRVSTGLLHEWRQRATGFESLEAYDDSQMLWRDRGRTEVLRGMRVTPGFFGTLGVDMALGRDLTGDDRAPESEAIVLTHELWIARFGGDPGVIGRSLEADDGAKRIVGVLPASFHGLRMSNPSEIPRYVALLPRDRIDPVACAGCLERVVGRLRSGTSAGAARAQLSSIAADYAAHDPQHAGTRVFVVPLLDRLVGPIRYALWLLVAAVLCVLLIACANIASLQLVRATARTREFATRTALGASRLRLASQVLIENLLLASVGGAAGIVLGSAGTSVLATWAPAETPRVDEIHMDVRVLAFACGLSLATGILFGLAPLVASWRVDINTALKKTSRVGGQAGGHQLRSTLVVVDLALAFVLVMVAGLLGRSLGNLRTFDAGFDPHDVLTLTPVASNNGPARTQEGRLAYYRNLIERVAAVPGVAAVGMVSNVPLSNIEPVGLFTDAGDAQLTQQTADMFIIGGRYFEALRIPLLAGRRFDTSDDNRDAVPAVLVSAAFAAHYFRGGDALNHRVRFGASEPWRQIVGVVGDVRYGRLDDPPGDAVYVPQSAFPWHYTRLVARTAGSPRVFQQSIMSAIHDVDPDEGIFHVQPMDDYVSSALASRRFPVNLLMLFGVVALVLSAVGLYGVLGFSVLQRTPEIALRRALGATARQILMLVMRQAVSVTVLGLMTGAIAGWMASQFIAAWLFGIGRTDLVTMTTTMGLLVAVSIVAAWIPLTHALRVEPMIVLRAE